VRPVRDSSRRSLRPPPVVVLFARRLHTDRLFITIGRQESRDQKPRAGEPAASDPTRRARQRGNRLGSGGFTVLGFPNSVRSPAMSGTSKGLKLDSITEDVRARYGPDLRNFDQLANQSLVAGNFAGAAGYFRHLAHTREQAAEEQSRGWITGPRPAEGPVPSSQPSAAAAFVPWEQARGESDERPPASRRRSDRRAGAGQHVGDYRCGPGAVPPSVLAGSRLLDRSRPVPGHGRGVRPPGQSSAQGIKTVDALLPSQSAQLSSLCRPSTQWMTPEGCPGVEWVQGALHIRVADRPAAG
jgi:hypothetical protein